MEPVLIEKIVVDIYNDCPANGKPKWDTTKKIYEYSVIACIIARLLKSSETSAVQNSDYIPIALGIGTKCAGNAREAMGGGYVVNDSHAEVIARRGFKRWLMKCLLMAIRNPSIEKETTFPLQRLVDGNDLDQGSKSNNSYNNSYPVYLIKKEWTFHLYISDSPCGDASIYPRDVQCNRLHGFTGAKLVNVDGKCQSNKVENNLYATTNMHTNHTTQDSDRPSTIHTAVNYLQNKMEGINTITQEDKSLPTEAIIMPHISCHSSCEEVTSSVDNNNCHDSTEYNSCNTTNNNIPKSNVIVNDDKHSVKKLKEVKHVNNDVLREDIQQLGALRTKSGRSDISIQNRTNSMSCTDKICKWNIIGIQGAILSIFIKDPIRFKSIVIGNDPLKMRNYSSNKNLNNDNNGNVNTSLNMEMNIENVQFVALYRALKVRMIPSIQDMVNIIKNGNCAQHAVSIGCDLVFYECLQSYLDELLITTVANSDNVESLIRSEFNSKCITEFVCTPDHNNEVRNKEEITILSDKINEDFNNYNMKKPSRLKSTNSKQTRPCSTSINWVRNVSYSLTTTTMDYNDEIELETCSQKRIKSCLNNGSVEVTLADTGLLQGATKATIGG